MNGADMGYCREGEAVQDARMDRAWPGNHEQLFFLHFLSLTQNLFSFLSIVSDKSSYNCSKVQKGSGLYNFYNFLYSIFKYSHLKAWYVRRTPKFLYIQVIKVIKA
jgi:hypothetical protein